MNEKGYSFAESILTLGILIVIFGSLLPFASVMMGKLSDKKLAAYAAETAFQGTVFWRMHGTVEGSRMLDGVQYDWTIEARGVCVRYLSGEKVKKTCIYAEPT